MEIKDEVPLRLRWDCNSNDDTAQWLLLKNKLKSLNILMRLAHRGVKTDRGILLHMMKHILCIFLLEIISMYKKSSEAESPF